MKHLLFDNGGRPLNNDDFVTFQDEIYHAVNGQFLGLPACVVAGCDVSQSTVTTGNFDIAPGLVFIDGEVRKFAGVTDVVMPQELVSDAFTTTELRAYQTGGSKGTMGEAVVIARAYNQASTDDKVKVTEDGVLTVGKAREGLFRQGAEIGMMADFPSEYDATGRGKYGTNSFGWALCNGQNNTPNMAGNFVAGYGSGQGNEYEATRRTGGAKEVELTADQNGQHSHTMQQAGQHSHTIGLASNANDGSQAQKGNGTVRTGNTSQAGNHSHTIDSSGLGQAHENRPPFVVLAFRMWVGF